MKSFPNCVSSFFSKLESKSETRPGKSFLMQCPVKNKTFFASAALGHAHFWPRPLRIGPQNNKKLGTGTNEAKPSSKRPKNPFISKVHEIDFF
jgi:hypothetical protein